MFVFKLTVLSPSFDELFLFDQTGLNFIRRCFLSIDLGIQESVARDVDVAVALEFLIEQLQSFHLSATSWV